MLILLAMNLIKTYEIIQRKLTSCGIRIGWVISQTSGIVGLVVGLGGCSALSLSCSVLSLFQVCCWCFTGVPELLIKFYEFIRNIWTFFGAFHCSNYFVKYQPEHIERLDILDKRTVFSLFGLARKDNQLCNGGSARNLDRSSIVLGPRHLSHKQLVWRGCGEDGDLI